jgi:hypothetical protein
MYHIFLDGSFYKSVWDVFTIELELGHAIIDMTFGSNRKVYITLADDYMAEDYTRKAA